MTCATSAPVLAVTGGKGGVGKSNLVLNLAVAMGKWGRRVLLVDGDLGLANLDVLLGLMPEHTVEQIVRDEIDIERALITGPHGIRILPAASGVPQLTNLDGDTRNKLLQLLADSAEGVDDTLVDTGAGLGVATLSLQLAASRVIVVTTPEPTSMVDAYATLKVLWSACPSKPVDIVVNAVRDDQEARRSYDQIARAAEHFLKQRPNWLGAVYSDPRVSDAVRKQKPLIELFPDCPAARCYEQIALRLASSVPATKPVDFWDRLMEPEGQEVMH